MALFGGTNTAVDNFRTAKGKAASGKAGARPATAPAPGSDKLGTPTPPDTVALASQAASAAQLARDVAKKKAGGANLLNLPTSTVKAPAARLSPRTLSGY